MFASYGFPSCVANRSLQYHATGPGGKAPGKQGGGNIVLSSVLAWSF